MNSMYRLSIAAALLFSVSFACGQEGLDPSVLVGKIANWPAPPYWNPPAHPVSVQEREGGLRTEGVLASLTSPLPFIGITPCRLVDTRQAGFPAGYGPPALVGGLPRDFDLNDDPLCPGIPGFVGAYSLNITVTNTQGPGFILIYPQGGAQPPVSTLNYVAGQTIANAAIGPAGADGGVTVIAGVSGTDLIIDINGYYAGSADSFSNTFLGLGAGNSTMTGGSNTAIGQGTLSNNTSGDFNTASGRNALFSNTTGAGNTALGAVALFSNTTGNDNTASGRNALDHNTAGTNNTANGAFALLQNTGGGDNTATGSKALYLNTSGDLNTATGSYALFSNTTGTHNTANGAFALYNSIGFTNIGIGYEAGSALAAGSDNICIGNTGVAGDSSTIRIGTVGIQTATFTAGIYGADATGGTAVFVTPSGKLGTTMGVSSQRFKEDIRDIAEESDGLMRLRPVAFKYQAQVDPTGLTQYGLIAEEVAEVYPDLVACGRDGKPETVRYHLVNALLLNELQKQHRNVERQQKANEAQEKTIEQQKAEIEALEARLSKLEARLLADSRP